MNEPERDLRPLGFGGYCTGWESLLPAGPRLEFPAMGRLQAGVMEWPEEACGAQKWGAVVIGPLTESMGVVEGVMARAAGALEVGGALLLEAENLHSPRSLRRVLEGRVGPCDPIGSLSDPTQYLDPARVLAAVNAAGLWVRDAIRVPSHPHELHGDFARDMFGAGLLPVTHAGGMPPWKLWIRAERLPQRTPGTVIVAPGDPAAQQQTVACLRDVLPPDWQVVCSEPEEGSSVAGLNRAVTGATGDKVWLLRAGATVDRTLYRALLAESVNGAAVPLGGDGYCDGDLSGLMLNRTSLLTVGPLDEAVRNFQVAAEDLLLRLQLLRNKVATVQDGHHAAPPMPVADPETFHLEGEALMGRWAVFNDVSTPLPSVDAHALAPRDRETDPPWAGRKPRISLCMIAKDEAAMLPECLRLAAPCVDEIVFVDTGSTDDTIAIAQAHGAEIVHFEWCDDFAAARNAGLCHATGDWILVLDADERLPEGAADEIRRLTDRPGVSGYHLHFKNNYSSGRSLGVLMVRLFRNLPGLAYEYRIHEQVTPSLARIGDPMGLVIDVSEIEVVHEGYREEVIAGKNKNERNEKLFRLQLRDHPDDVYALYKYGDFLRSIPGREGEAHDVLKQCLDTILERPPVTTRTLPFAGEVAALVALAHLHADRIEEGRRILDTALRRCLATPNLHYIAAGLALAEHNNDVAIAHFEACLRYRGQVLVVPIQEGITGHIAVAGIAQAHMQKGDRGTAQQLLEQAIAMEPAWEVSHLNLARLYLEQGDIGRALGVLTDHLQKHPDSPAAAQQATLLLRQLGQRDHARAMGQHALQLYRERQQLKEADNVERVLASLG